MKNKTLKLSFIALCAVTATEVVAANPPVVIEMFGRNECSIDTLSQEDIWQTMSKEENVLLINCRKHFTDEQADNKFAHKFCNERAKSYENRISFGFFKVPMVIVNGRWEANFENVHPAVKMGSLDQVKAIDLSLNQGALDIALPKIDIEENTIILVYAYMPTQGKKAVLVDPDLELTAEIKEKIQAGQSVPFVTETQSSSLYLKPVIAKERIGEWKGEMLRMSYPLDGMKTLAGLNADELSYVVVAHRGNETGEVVAAGEYISPAEMQKFYNQGGPKIERRSNPVLWAEDL